MNEHFFLILLAVLNWSVMCQAQTTQPDVSTQRVSYIQRVPKEVQRQKPAGVKSCFYGEWAIASTEKTMAVHFYIRRPLRKLADPANAYRTAVVFGADIFESMKVEEHQRFRKLNSYTFKDVGYLEDEPKFSVEFIWLDPLKKIQPILIFEYFTSSPYGSIGDKFVTVFNRGWTKPPVVQKFFFDQGSGAGASSVTRAHFSRQLDDKGMVQFYTVKWNPPDDYPAYATRYLWNGQRFELAEQRALSITETRNL